MFLPCKLVEHLALFIREGPGIGEGDGTGTGDSLHGATERQGAVIKCAFDNGDIVLAAQFCEAVREFQQAAFGHA